jgi:hypothetical protein
MKTATDESIEARVIPVLRNLGKAVDCVALSRMIRTDDSSAIFRILAKHPSVKTHRGIGLTMFEWVG